MLDRLSFSNGFYSFKLGVGIFTGLDFRGCLISQALAGICRLGHRCSIYLYLLLKSNMLPHKYKFVLKCVTL
jgi:hypothetical protein